MRKLPLFVFATLTALTFAGASQAMPLSAAGSLAAANASVAADDGATIITAAAWRSLFASFAPS